MRIVALNAIHLAFQDGMVLGKLEFGLGVEVALETGGGVPAGIDDEVGPGRARGDVFAGRAMARFTSVLPGMRDSSKATGRADWKERRG